MTDNDLLSICNEYLKYNSATGVITWIKSTGPRAKLGQEAGYLNINGYRHISIMGKSYKTHRLAFLMYWWYLPKFIDHKDHIKDNNQINNLRGVTKSQNNTNAPLREDNKSGYKGVCWWAHGKRWRAQIGANKKRYFLGYFNCPHCAAKVYNEAAIKFQGHEFCYTNEVSDCDCAETIKR